MIILGEIRLKDRVFKTRHLRRVRRKNILFVCILLTLLYSEYATVKADSTAETTILGYNIQIYFNPSPGLIFRKNISAVVNIEGNFTGYMFAIRTVRFQLIKGYQISKEYYAYDDVHLSNLTHSWHKEILLDIPESDFAVRKYRCEFTVEVYWKQSEESSEQSQELFIEGAYTPSILQSRERRVMNH